MGQPVEQTSFRWFCNLFISVWKYSSYKWDVKWPPIKDICSWLQAAWLGNWVPWEKAQAETGTGGTEGTESVGGGLRTCLEHSAVTVASAVQVVEDPAVRGGERLPVGQAAAEFSWGWKTPFSGRQNLASLAVSDWWIAVAQLSAKLSGGWGASALTKKKSSS